MLEATDIEAIISDLVFMNIYCSESPDYGAMLKDLEALNLSYQQTYEILQKFVRENTNVYRRCNARTMGRNSKA